MHYKSLRTIIVTHLTRKASVEANGEMQYAITLEMKYKCHYAQLSEITNCRLSYSQL